MAISLEEIQSVIGTTKIPEGFLTRQQWEKELGVANHKMLSILHSLNDKGCLQTTQIEKKNIGGRKTTVPAYKIEIQKKGLK